MINLTGELSLLQNTVRRLAQHDDVRPPIIVVGEEHRFLTKTQIEALGLYPHFEVLLEPCGKNTAPAICAASATGSLSRNGGTPHSSSYRMIPSA